MREPPPPARLATVTRVARLSMHHRRHALPIRPAQVEAGQKVLQDKQKVLEEQQAADKLAQEALAAELPKVRTTISALEDQFHAATTDAKEREAAATVQRDALSSEVARIDSDLQAQGNKLGTMISKYAAAAALSRAPANLDASLPPNLPLNLAPC
jgi:predicted  nucleic acid-binding Zn-ribbon protein